MKMANEDTNLSLNMYSNNMYNSKLEEKTAELKDAIEVKKRELAEAQAQKEVLEKSLEDNFIELEGTFK